MRCITYERGAGTGETCLICETPKGTHIKIIKGADGRMGIHNADEKEVEALVRELMKGYAVNEAVELERENLKKLVEAFEKRD